MAEKEKMQAAAAIFHITEIKKAFEKEHLNTEAEALQMGIDAMRQPEIIRCKDCKYWLQHAQFGYDEDNEEYHDYCARLVPEDDYYAFQRNADEYCSRAERKRDGRFDRETGGD